MYFPRHNGQRLAAISDMSNGTVMFFEGVLAFGWLVFPWMFINLFGRGGWQIDIVIFIVYIYLVFRAGEVKEMVEIRRMALGQSVFWEYSLKVKNTTFKILASGIVDRYKEKVKVLGKTPEEKKKLYNEMVAIINEQYGSDTHIFKEVK